MLDATRVYACTRTRIGGAGARPRRRARPEMLPRKTGAGATTGRRRGTAARRTACRRSGTARRTVRGI